jgi:hypothetical protein
MNYWDGAADKLILAFETQNPNLGIFGQRYDVNGNAEGASFCHCSSRQQGKFTWQIMPCATKMLPSISE